MSTIHNYPDYYFFNLKATRHCRLFEPVGLKNQLSLLPLGGNLKEDVIFLNELTLK